MKQLILLGSVLLFVINPLKAQNSISGYIVSLETAKPIADATIFLNNRNNLPLKNPDSLKVTSDSTGFYKITGIKPGYYIINAWTTYRIMNQQYAMVIESNKFKIGRNMNIDFVFSKNAFKMELSVKDLSRKAFWKEFVKSPHKRSSDDVARRADRPQIYFNSQRDTVGAFFIQKIKDFKDARSNTPNKAHQGDVFR